jgi:uroporphyrinogen decarboxylase
MATKKWWKGAVKAEPNFENLLKVLRREKPDRPTLFEFFMNEPLYKFVNGQADPAAADRYTDAKYGNFRRRIGAFRDIGYDYVTIGIPEFGFPRKEQARQQTISLNEAFLITDRKSFDAYAWPDPNKADYGILDALAPELPKGMKMIVCGPCGVLENANFILGYENMCYLIADGERLAEDVFEAIGSRLLKYYQRVVKHPAVGAIIGNDDWGFKSQPMLSPDDMRRFVFPWHKQIVAAAHAAGKPAILHSCGNLASVLDDITNDIRYDGKHSYEDTILPVEKAYEQYGSRIAILGGMDVDFIVRSPAEEVYKRSKAMVEKAAGRGGYGLGTGNSVPEYIPRDNYFAMVSAATEGR